MFWMVNMGVKGLFDMGRFGVWDWLVDYGYLQSIVDMMYCNWINVVGFENMFVNGIYNFLNLVVMLNGLNGVFMDDDQQVILKVDSVIVKVLMLNFFMLFGGLVGLGLGIEFCYELLMINLQMFVLQGVFVFVNVQMVEGLCNVVVVFYQVDILILCNLMFMQVGCYDYYSDFGGVFLLSFVLCFQLV